MEKFLDAIKESGAKLTHPRKAVLEKLYSAPKPLTLKEIHNKCKKVDFASVYRSIKLFHEISIVEEITFADKKIRYELVSNLHHHHIICSECGEIKELPVCIVSEIKKLTEYIITKHTFEFMGLCPKCQN
jgi:Fur family transcriptional regulator, zinc uptake regulator